MRFLLLIGLLANCSANALSAQVAVELSYGVDRNVDSPNSEIDGWLNGTVEWMFPSGVGVGIGTDHYFEKVAISRSDFEGWALYLSTSFERPMGRVAPFLRAGLGVGRAPCQGDTCSGGAHLRGSGGVRVRLRDAVRISGELGFSRVSRPFAGAGLSLRS